MKKLTAVLIIILFTYAGFSQGRFRVQAGPVFNYLIAKETTSAYGDLHVGYTFGAGYEMFAGKKLSIQPELNYIGLRTLEKVTNAKIRLSYLQVPVLVKLSNAKKTFGAYMGPQLAFLTKASSERSGVKSDVSQNMGEVDFAGVFGIEFISPINLAFNVRFTQGLSNVNKVEFTGNSSRHQIFGLTVGYVFGNN